MWTVKAITLLVVFGVTLANPYPKETKFEQNSLDYQIDPQVLNYHLQQLLLQQEQQQTKEQVAQPTTVQVPAQQYSVSNDQDEAKYQQAQLQAQIQAQLQQQLALQLQAQNDGKASHAVSATTQAPPSNSLTVHPYQTAGVQYQQSAVQYQQPVAHQQQPAQPQYQDAAQYQIGLPQQYQQYQLGTVKQYQLPTAPQGYQSTAQPAPVQSFPVAAHQQVQPGLQLHQAAQTALPQNSPQKLLGVAYSSAVDASKTHFTGYGIKYSF